MKKYSILIAAVSVLALADLFGQELPPIQTDRPDQTECPFIVPPRHFQIENGFNFESVNKNEKNFLYPTTLWKYGVNELFELRVITELSTIKIHENESTGISPVKLGIKTNLTKEHGIVPTISFIGHLAIPFMATDNFNAIYYVPSFRFTLQHTLTERISLGYNLGAEWDGETAEPEFIYTLATGFSLTEKIGAYIEIYGFAPQMARAEHRAGGGFGWFLKPNILLDLSGGIGITYNAPDYYGSLGFSIRLPN
jgi:hypothetical protein